MQDMTNYYVICGSKCYKRVVLYLKTVTYNTRYAKLQCDSRKEMTCTKIPLSELIVFKRTVSGVWMQFQITLSELQMASLQWFQEHYYLWSISGEIKLLS